LGYTTLEDFFGDIVGKARRGGGLSVEALSEKSGLSTGGIEKAESYELTPSEAQIGALAAVLNLDSGKLARIAAGWVPEGGNETFLSDEVTVTRLILDAGMDVNCYLMKCLKTGEAVLVDPGAQIDRILAHIAEEGASVSQILLTHGHGDHVGALGAAKAATGARVFCSERDYGLLGGNREAVDVPVEEGWSTTVGQLAVSAISLPGHTPGGTGFVFSGGLFSGDALFAGSLGGAQGAAYQGQISAVGEKVLSRQGSTRIFPGHGPLTSVENERSHNPFFAF
jgi:hydroxyacylglutathione hydrolase